MDKIAKCGCGGKFKLEEISTELYTTVDIRTEFYICCTKCGIDTPIFKTREGAINCINRAMSGVKNVSSKN